MNKYSEQGFSLIELIMVLVVLGILAVVAVPRFTGGDAYQTRAFSDELRAAVRYGQKIAVASGCRVQVQLSSGNYALFQDDDCQGGAFTVPLPHPARQTHFAAAAPSGS
jgi:MSHA pilin protein MshC